MQPADASAVCVCVCVCVCEYYYNNYVCTYDKLSHNMVNKGTDVVIKNC